MKKSALFFRWLNRERSIVMRIYFLAGIQGLMYLAIPLGLQGVVTYIMAGSFSASLVLLSMVTVVAIAFIGYFQLWQMRLNETLHQKIFADISSKISLLTGSTSSGKKLNRFSEIPMLQKGISKILLDFSFSIISIVFGLLILPLYSNWFLLFTLVLGLAFFFINTYYGKRGIENNVATSNSKYRLWEGLQKADEQRIPMQEESESNLEDYIERRTSLYTVLEKQFLGIIIFKVIFTGVLLFLGAWLVQAGELNIGQFLASEIIIILVINAVEKLVSSLNTFYDVITSVYKLETLLNAREGLSLLHEREQGLVARNRIYNHPYSNRIKFILTLLFLAGLIVLFMPWTQTVQANGKVSTLHPSGRPQTVTSRIAGRIEKWYIREGDFVKKNDTIAFISEIKDEYVDPQLIQRSEKIIQAKEVTIGSYEQKINSVDQQIDALNSALRLKLDQNKNKIRQVRAKVAADSVEAATALANLNVAEEQMKRYEDLAARGIISKTDLENRRVKVQDAVAKKTSAENKLIGTRNELLNAEIELRSISQEYQEKLMKAESDKFSALSMLYESEGALTKLQNQLANYNMRQGFYYVLAPQDGYITRTTVQGLGEIIKEGAALCSIVPDQDEQAAELYVDPVDLPLIRKGQKVQLQFDGWPAFVFSGWPGVSYGTYAAEVVAFDKVLSDNGKFRVLVKSAGSPWPDAIQIGSGVRGMALLSNVPVVYELWRQVNGFPPEFYKEGNKDKKDKKDEKK